MDTVNADTTCYRHPKRETFVRCSRCDRYICSDCMRDAPVGQRCPDCVKGENKTIRQGRTVFGGKTITTPWVTTTLIALNVVAYLVELIVPSVIDRFDSLGIGLLGADGQYYVDDGGPVAGYDQVGILHGEWWRLITSAFLHAEPGPTGYGIAHIVLNMVWLWIIGRFLEEKLGRARYLSLYLLAAVGGSALAVLIDPHQAGIGASGAGFGLIAAYFVVTRKLHEYPIDRTRLIVYFLFWLVLSAGFASWQAHLGGMLVGFVAGFGLAYAPRERRALVQGLVLGAIALLLIVVVVAKAMAVGDGT